MKQKQLELDLATLKESFSSFPEATIDPGFIAVNGLPGTGKTFFCQKLSERQSFCILESDALRKTLFPYPCYSADGNIRLFAACHSLIEWLLNKEYLS